MARPWIQDPDTKETRLATDEEFIFYMKLFPRELLSDFLPEELALLDSSLETNIE